MGEFKRKHRALIIAFCFVFFAAGLWSEKSDAIVFVLIASLYLEAAYTCDRLRAPTRTDAKYLKDTFR